MISLWIKRSFRYNNNEVFCYLYGVSRKTWGFYIYNEN